jgi:hypothetical protein
MTNDVEAALADIDDAQAALRRKVKRVARARLEAQPAPGVWSPMEHVQHLIFAEQHHFSQLLERGFRWSSIGVAPPNRTGERRLNAVGKGGTGTIDEVFDAWARVHAFVGGLPMPDALKLRILQGNLRHVQFHAGEIERLLKG